MVSMARQTAWWLNGDFAAVCAFVFLCTGSLFCFVQWRKTIGLSEPVLIEAESE